MNIALISKGTTEQDHDLIEEANLRGHKLTNFTINSIILDKELTALKEYDVVYWRVGNPKIREISALECFNNGIPFINSGYYRYPLLGSKAYQMYFLNKNNIQVPQSILFAPKNKSDFENIILQFPCVMKDLINAQGKGVSLIHSKEELSQRISLESSPVVLLQEFLENNGDYRVLVVGGKAIGVYKREPNPGEFRSNISLGGHAVSFTDSQKITIMQKIAEKAANALGLEIAGIDILESNGVYYVIETNSIPQWQGFKEATEINVAGKIFDYFESLI
jgi:ribosomal protein S6--L-glutamate ligase